MRGIYPLRMLAAGVLLLPFAVLAQRGTPVQHATTISRTTSMPRAWASSAPSSATPIQRTTPAGTFSPEALQARSILPAKAQRPSGLFADYRQGGPVNDDCAGATTLTMGASCVPTSGTTAGASMSLAAILCNTFTGDADDDVWFKFTATATSATIRVDGDAEFDAVVDLRSGACNGTNIGCADATVDDGIEQIVQGGLTIGAQYYVRVYDYFTGAAPTPGFTICVFNTPAAPANDQCFNVVPQNLNIGGSLTLNGTTAGATLTNDAVAASDLDDGIPKVWHAFTIGSCADVTIDYCGTTPAFDQIYIAIAGSCPANTGTLGAYDFTTCPDGNGTVVFTALPAGTYYVPVGQFGAGSTGAYTLHLAAAACAAPPANDNCAGAIVLPVNTSCQPTSGTVLAATQSLPAILCNNFTGDANDDVWYSFVATAANLTVRVAGSDSLDAVVELMSNTCGNNINIGCADATFVGGVEVIPATGLQVGQTYYVRVYDYYTAVPFTTTFDICVYGGGTAPPNDQCFNVVPGALNVGGQLTFTGTNVGATNTNDAVGGSALDVTGDTTTVWHAFTTTTCANVTLSYCATTPAFGTVWIVLTQSCPANQLVFPTTTDFTTCGNTNATIQFDNLPAGTYYVPVYGDGGTQGNYSILATATACGGGTPPNDQCFNVVPGALNVGGQLTFNGNNVGATSTNDAVPGSGLDVAPDTTTVWHAFTTTTCANVTLSYCGTTPAFGTVWVVLAQTCPADQLVFPTTTEFTTCADTNATIFFANLPAGTYYVPVYGDGDTQGNYTILATATACGTPPANDDCANVIALPVWTPNDCPANATTGNNALATQDGGEPSCDSTDTALLDVWYIFNSGPYSTVTVNFDNGTMTDWVVVVSDGCSGAELACEVVPAAPIVLTVPTFTSYTVRVYSNTDFGVGGDFTICLTGDLGTSVEPVEGLSWSLYPNPTNGEVNLIWSEASEMATIELLDATGRLVRQQRQSLQQGTNVLVAPDASLKPGAYLVRVTTSGTSTEQRVIVR